MAHALAEETAVSDANFEKFREFFYRRTGIRFDQSKRYFVDRRLLERIRLAGTASFADYFSKLLFDTSGNEVQHLINAMTVNETYFFREEYQFACLVSSMLPEIVSRKKRNAPVRIWVIPGSSGEEAYSVAIYLLEKWPDIATWDVEIISSDIDTDVIAAARRGLYSKRSVQNVPPDILRRHFVPAGEHYQVEDELRRSIEFTRVNITDAADTRRYRHFDVVFCRNLLIYFDSVANKAAAETIFDALDPGGYVCLGHAESMSRISPLFRVRKFPEAIVYQRPLEVS